MNRRHTTASFRVDGLDASGRSPAACPDRPRRRGDRGGRHRVDRRDHQNAKMPSLTGLASETRPNIEQSVDDRVTEPLIEAVLAAGVDHEICESLPPALDLVSLRLRVEDLDL